MLTLLLTLLLVALYVLAGYPLIPKSVAPTPTQRLTLGFLLGALLSTLLVIVLDRLGLPLTLLVFLLGQVLLTGGIAALHLRRLRDLPKEFAFSFEPKDFPSVQWVFLPLFIYLALPMFWRAYYQPVVPDDSILGMDLVAKFAVREGQICSSLFTAPMLAADTQNQMYYAPFTMLMQIVYRLLGWDFGQVWLPLLANAFFLWLYAKLNDYLHPLLSGLSVLILVTTPEFYGYTYLLQTDLINAAFFAIGAICLTEGVLQGGRAHWIDAGLFWGGAVWIRSETIIFCGGITGAVFLIQALRKKQFLLLEGAFALSPAVLFFLIWHGLYFGAVFPDPPENQIRLELTDFGALAGIFAEMNRYIFDLRFWEAIVPLFFILVIGSGGWELYRRFGQKDENQAWGDWGWPLLMLAMLYVAFGFIVYHFPAANVPYTFRRGFFKFLPLFLYCWALTGGLRQLSAWLWKLEGTPPKASATKTA